MTGLPPEFSTLQCELRLSLDKRRPDWPLSEFAVTAKLFRQMQLLLEVFNEVLEFGQIVRRRFD